LINHFLSVPLVQTTRLSIKPTQTEKILMLLVLAHVPVLGMAVLFPIVWLIFKKVKGILASKFLKTYCSSIQHADR
jgi:hypothetical protein